MNTDRQPLLEDVLVSLCFPEDPQLSPDGRWVAYVATPYGREGDHPEGSIWLAPTDGSAPARQFTSGAGRDERPRWSPDGRSIAFLSDRAERGTSAIYLVPLEGGEARQLLRRKSNIEAFEWSPDGRSIAFTSPDEPTEADDRRKKDRDDADVYGERWKYARLHVLDVQSGEISTLPSRDRHVSDFAWSPDNDRIAWFSQETPELESRVRSEIVIRGIGAAEATRVCEVQTWAAHNLRWMPDGRHLLFLGSHEPTLSAITTYAIDLSGGEPRVLGPGPDDDACASSFITVPSASNAVLAIAHGLSTRLEWLDPESGKRNPLYEPEFGDISREFSVIVPEGKPPVMAVIHSTGSQPPEVHVGRPNSLRPISDHHAALSGFGFGTQEPFYWTSPDGLTLDGVLIRPPGNRGEPYPTIVHVHGGPYGRYTDGWNLRPGHWAQWLAYHGYAVLMPNYRGGMGHGNAFAKWAHGGVGEHEFGDVMSAVDAAIERGIADPNRLGIGGWSQGGFMTAWAVTQTHRFKAGVMGAGVSDWNMMVMTSDIPTIESMLGGSRPWDGPGPHRSMDHSPISYAKSVKTPLLILHGQNDARVPVSQAIGYHRALREIGATTQLVTYPREPHGIRERAHQRDMLRRVRDWFQNWL